MKSRSRVLLLLSLIVLVAGVLTVLGLFEVAPGQVAVAPSSAEGSPRVWEAGRHWRWLGDRGLLRLPREAVALTRDVELSTAEGAAVVLEVTGELAVEAGREGRWIEAAGSEPFAEALSTYLKRSLEPEIRRLEPEELFSAASVSSLERAVRTALGEAGVAVEGLSL
jgi:hypothetical protein